MDLLIRHQSRNTPYVLFDPNEGVLMMRGRSSPDNSNLFYEPLYQSIAQLGEKAKQLSTLRIEFMLDYFNTSSSKCIYILFEKVAKLKQQGMNIEVNWHSEKEDYDIIETGEDFEDLTQLKFNYILT